MSGRPVPGTALHSQSTRKTRALCRRQAQRLSLVTLNLKSRPTPEQQPLINLINQNILAQISSESLGFATV
ncbi:hypothetical protein KOW79_006763 [Hemibagrus wyckioides]|uniref:Uncharacterized protein n=1 Tax=Hemibagrus wyckioides TaxID=337641 RepID=A0A9D3NXW3_9TELE|nr:hypothetical protein KOW79_006763 [Hemibagrus wyckioides]